MKEQKNGCLYMIPCPIAEDQNQTIPESVVEIVHGLKHFIAERARTTRRWIKSTDPPYAIAEIVVDEIPQKLSKSIIAEMLKPIHAGHDIGMVSEAGCPGIADPGAHFVSHCHDHQIVVVPLVGPSSILLALIASGLDGQQFHFHGYLSAKKNQLKQELRSLEQKAKNGVTQIFMETPYRNQQVLDAAIATLNNQTRFCVALNLTSSQEWVRTAPINHWKSMDYPELHKRPCIFLIGKKPIETQ